MSFKSWNGNLKGLDSDAVLRFYTDSRVVLEDMGISVLRYEGSYALKSGGAITIRLEGYRWNWPDMILRRDGGDLILNRVDGVTSWPIEAVPSDAGIEGFWPFRAKP